MTRSRSVVAFLLVALAAAAGPGGCQSNANGPGGSASMTNAIDQLAGEWILKQIEGTDVASLLPAGARPPSLNFAPDGRVSGFGGVNRLAGGVDLEALPKGNFKLGQMISTKMAGPPQSMQLEDRFTRLLGEATGFKLGSGDSLSLTKEGTSILDFVRAGK